MGGTAYDRFGERYLVVGDPLFLSGTVQNDCFLFCAESADSAIKRWSEFAKRLGLGKIVTEPVNTFSSGERLAAALLLFAAVAESQGLSELDILVSKVEASLSPARLERIKQILAELTCRVSLHRLNEHGEVVAW